MISGRTIFGCVGVLMIVSMSWASGTLTLTHSSNGYIPGTTMDITVRITLSDGTFTGLGMEETLPSGFTFHSLVSGTLPESAPTLPVSFVEFVWDGPPNIVEFTYRVNVPPSASGPQEISGKAIYRLLGIPGEQQSTAVTMVEEAEPPVPHPADLNADWRVVLSEAIAYLAGWQQGTNPIGYAIRAAYLWQSGEYYVYDANQAPPVCWVLAP